MRHRGGRALLGLGTRQYQLLQFGKLHIGARPVGVRVLWATRQAHPSPPCLHRCHCEDAGDIKRKESSRPRLRGGQVCQHGLRGPPGRGAAGGQDSWRGWMDISPYPPQVGWVPPRMGPDCSLGLLLQAAGWPEEP